MTLTTSTTSLADRWRDRLNSDSAVLSSESLRDDLPELEAAVSPAGFALEDVEGYVEISGNEITLEMRGELTPPSTFGLQESGFVDLAIETEQGELFLESLDLPAQIQLNGLGTAIFGRLALLAEDLGLASIELQAGKVGRWAWMRCGVDFADRDARTIVVDAAAEFAERLGVKVDLSHIEHSWDFVDLAGFVSAEQVLNAGGPRFDPLTASMPLGKALVLGPPLDRNLWFGRLILEAESTGRVRLRDYLLSGDPGEEKT